MEPVRFKNLTAIVLAGGKSTRMGGVDKSMLPVGGIPMIRHIVRQLELHFAEIIIGGDEDKYGFLGHRVINDAEKFMGPLMGIYSCLKASQNDLNFITACDIPEINTGFLSEMLELSGEADIVMPVKGNDEYEPLHALYRKSVVPVAGSLLMEERLKISDLAGLVKTRFIPFDGRGWYYNINTIDDYKRYASF